MELKGWKKDNINIILLGETGVGKTTFISYIDNMCRGRKLEEFENTCDLSIETGRDGRVTQTNEVRLYTITCIEGQTPRSPNSRPKTINILDTPGIADTRGSTHDRLHKERINTEIKNKLDAVDAVVIMVNGTQERLSVTANYTLQSIFTMLPRSLLPNIAFVSSKCTIATTNFNVSLLPEHLQQSPSWPIQNPLAIWSRYQAARRTEDAAQSSGKPSIYSEEDLEEMHEEAKKAHRNGIKFLDKFIHWLDACPVQPTKEIDELNKRLHILETEVSNIISRLTAIQEAEMEIKKTQERITQAEDVGQKEKLEALQEISKGRLVVLKEEIQKKQNEISVLCNQYRGMSISRGFAGYIYSMKEMLLQRFDARSKEGAPQMELDDLTKLIQQFRHRYDIAEKADNNGQHLGGQNENRKLL